MKKTLILLLIAILYFFLLYGCQGLVPAEGEGEGEGEIQTPGVTVGIEGAVTLDNKTYLAHGTHEITVIFPDPVAGNVKGYITYKNDSAITYRGHVSYPLDLKGIVVGEGDSMRKCLWMLDQQSNFA